MVVGYLSVGSTSYEVSACTQTTRFLLDFSFLEAREDHGRAPRGERLKQACICSPYVVGSERSYTGPRMLLELVISIPFFC